MPSKRLKVKEDYIFSTSSWWGHKERTQLTVRTCDKHPQLSKRQQQCHLVSFCSLRVCFYDDDDEDEDQDEVSGKLWEKSPSLSLLVTFYWWFQHGFPPKKMAAAAALWEARASLHQIFFYSSLSLSLSFAQRELIKPKWSRALSLGSLWPQQCGLCQNRDKATV